MVNFSEVMAAIVGRYGNQIHIDPIDQNNDTFFCPHCKDYIIYGDWDGEIEQIGEGENAEYICPICGKKF